ncbi:MAG: anti-sigma factor [Bacteroidia bacterium]|nr:anti-sigma factor [Bacteroidia bacterium]
MNAQEYISSGILELYVAGALPEAEAIAVREAARKDPAIQAEIEAIEAAMIRYAESLTEQPDPALLAGVMSAIGAEQAPPAAQVRPLYLRAWAIAASVLLFASAILNLVFFGRWQDASREIAVLNNDRSQIAAERASYRERYEASAAELELIGNPEIRIVRMTGQAKAPDARALVYWNPKTAEVKLKTQQLAGLEAGYQYQLWAIKGGQPVDAGVFDPSDTLLLQKAITEGAEAFAVTIEKTGGSPVPTLEQMVLLGAVAS